MPENQQPVNPAPTVLAEVKASNTEKSKKPFDAQKVLNGGLAVAFISINLLVILIIAYLFSYSPLPDATAVAKPFPALKQENYEIAKQTIISRQVREQVSGAGFKDPYKLDSEDAL